MNELFQGTLLLNEPMANYTSWRVGGAADRIYRPRHLVDLIAFMRSLTTTESVMWVGLGSNLLVRDGGIRGTVINTQGCLSSLAQMAELTIRAEAGVSCAQLARYSARLALTGMEFMAGIPGTVGGALAMNAGCFGGEVWQSIKAVECLNRQGEVILRQPEEFLVSYRSVQGPPNEWFIAGHFELTKGDKEDSLALIRRYLQHRSATQPTGEPSCGSVFRNPPGDYAGRLIEDCGLKGYRVGGAAVSDKHANFIVNLGNASADDIEALIKLIMETVRRRYGISLLPEVHIVGEPRAMLTS